MKACGAQGVAGKLVRAAVAELKAQGLQAKTSCWYAAQWFERHPEEQGLLWKELSFQKVFSARSHLGHNRRVYSVL